MAGYETAVIGGLRRKEWTAAPYSAADPIIKPPSVFRPHRTGPDAMSVSEDSPATAFNRVHSLPAKSLLSCQNGGAKLIRSAF